MRDFDSVRAGRIGQDRTFRIGGQEFEIRASVRPETIADWDAASAMMLPTEFLSVIDRTVLDFLVGGYIRDDHQFPVPVTGDDGEPEVDEFDRPRYQVGPAGRRWLDLRHVEGDDALSLGDIRDVVAWMVDTQTSRPTGPREASIASRGNGGTTSTDGSSLLGDMTGHPA